MMLLSALLSIEPSLERNATSIRKPLLDLFTSTPCCTTSEGSRGVASVILFCTCTWAVSGLVPWAKVRVMLTLPVELEDELKYSRWSRLVICCSMTWVTLRSTVCALAPG